MAEVIRISESAEPAAAAALPQNVEAEAALLGALMIDNRLVEDVQLKLKPHHFFEPLHGRIYEAILKLTDRNMVANPVTLRPTFEADEAMKELGGPAYLATLTGSGAAIIGAKDFAQQVYDLALLRALIGVGRDLVEGALDTSEDVAPLEQIERAETELYKVAEEGGAEGKAKSFGDATKLAVQMAEKALNSGGHLSGITTGLEGINSKVGGLHKSDLVILAGRPGHGENLAGDQHRLRRRAALLARYRRRDRTEQVGRRSGRLLQPRNVGGPARDAYPRRGIGHQLREPPHGQDQPAGVPPAWPARPRSWRACRSTSTTRRASPSPRCAPARRRLKRQKGIGCVVVDYLQLLQGTGRSGNDNRVQEISEISRGLKQLAKELELPVLALSQLSRAVEQREDKRPQLSDLRESGSIEQDADMVWFVYRGDYYLAAKKPDDDHPDFAAWHEEMNRIYGRADLIVAKQRHGATGTVRMKFDSRITKFSDAVDDAYLPEMRS